MKIALDPSMLRHTPLLKLGFGDRDDTIKTPCVFAWEERARESSTFMRKTIDHDTGSW